MGYWGYAYDRQGKLIGQSDACGNATNLSYDTLERLTAKGFTKGNIAGSNCNTANVAYSVSYSYDQGHSSSNRSRGQLTQVKYSDNSYQKDLDYNNLGLLLSETVYINGGASGGYTSIYGYDAFQRPASLTYPDNEVVTTYTNPMGLPSRLYSNQNSTLVNGTIPGGGQTSGVSYDEAGRLTAMRLAAGGNLWRTQKYAPFNQQSSDGGLLDAIYVGTTNNGSATDYNRLRLEYDYDSFANITTLREGFNGGGVATWTAAYDAHNRVTSAFGQSYSYDAAGRITSYEGTTLGYDSLHKHAVNTVAGTDRFDYDANGNVVKRDKGLSTQQTLGWNVENRLLSIAAPGLVEWYYYDENGTRIKKTSNGVNTFYPFPHYEVEVNGSTTTATKYYFFNGMRVAMKEGSSALVYLNGDHLSSAALATTNTGTFQERQGYYGYGKYRTGGVLPTDNRYTGQKLDAATGLYYYGARYYDRNIGQFVSPDSLVPDPTNVWDYNRYGYARLNPLKYNDPTGYYSDDEIMTNYGCEDWNCVEAIFQEGGAYEGLWGWLYTLQQAQDGDAVVSTMMGQSGNHSMVGVFGRDADGKIFVSGQSYFDPTGGRSFSGTIPEGGFATFAAGSEYGAYELHGANRWLTVGRGYKHNYTSIAPGTLLITAAKAGTSIGPALTQAGTASCLTGVACPVGATVAAIGQAYTYIGWGVTIVNDYALPIYNGDWQTVRFNASVEIVAQAADRAGSVGKRIAPMMGPAVDIVQGLCYGTGCRR